MPSPIISPPAPPAGAQQARTWFVPAAIGVGSLLLTLLLWQVALFQSHQADHFRFDRLSDTVQKTIQHRLEQHERALRGLKGLYAASKSVERGEFREYVQSLDLSAYSGALGFGFIRYVPRDNLEKFLTQTRADEAPNFLIHPTGTRPDLYVVEYIEPQAANIPAQGRDIGAESGPREAAIRAVEENRVILTRRITLGPDQDQAPGFFLFLPIYANRAPIATAADRWRSLTGWAYCPILIDQLMKNIVADTSHPLAIEVFEDDATLRSALIFDVDGHIRASGTERITDDDFYSRKFHKQSTLTWGGRHWILHTSTLSAFEHDTEHRLPWFVLLGGLLSSALLTFAVSSSYRARRKAVSLAATMTVELREEINQREQTAKVLRELSNFQEAIVLSADHAIISTTPEGVIRVFNPAAQRLLGYTEVEIIGRHTLAVFHLPAEVQSRAREFSAELGFTIEPGFDVFVIKSCKGLPNEHEWTCVRQDGSHVPVMLSVTAIHDGHGGFSGYLGVAVDITERKRAWAELVQSRQASDEARHEVELQRDALDQHAIVSIADPKGIILHANERFCTISGYSRQELIGKTHRIINSGCHPPVFWQDFWQTICGGKAWHGEICNRAKDGSLYWLNATVVPFHDSQGAISRFVAIRTDISARKRAEAELIEARKIAETANQSKSEFLAEMSHEIRTPMNAVLGFTELLATTALNEKQRNFVGTIQLSGQNLLTIINDILDYSKIEAGKLEVERLDFDAVITMESVVKTLSLQAKSKSLALISHCLPGTPRQVSADPTRVRQVLLNLIGNALKFTKKGGVTLTTERVPTAGNPCLRFAIADTGIGLSPEQQARLFTKFTQATASTTREFGGTGLGLAICKRLVELMGGEIGVASQEGRGSTFWFTLPLATNEKRDVPPAPAPTHKIEPITLPPPAQRSRPWQVLVVDDNAINQQLACAFLSKLNCVSTVANDGEEAARVVQQKNFDLVLMDYQMPKMDGMQSTAAIRHWESAQPGKKPLKIIALTANLNPELSSNFIACGMDACLSKPLMFPELKALIGQISPASSPPIPSPSAAASPPAPATSGPTTAMNRDRALQLTDHNPVLLGMLANAFLAQCDGLMASIRQAFKSRDEAALKAHAHKLKGSISIFAAESAHTVVLALNIFPSPADWTKLDELGRQLEIEIARLRPELAALSASASSK
jgi:PAS domain S-box-containing protein